MVAEVRGEMSPGSELWLLLLLAVAATYLWRGLGVALSARIDPQGATFQWVSCVSHAMLAGLIARMIVLPLAQLQRFGADFRKSGRRPGAKLLT